jgi:hypothetical protein
LDLVASLGQPAVGGLQQDWRTSALRHRWIITRVAVRRDGQQKCGGGPLVALRFCGRHYRVPPDDDDLADAAVAIAFAQVAR